MFDSGKTNPSSRQPSDVVTPSATWLTRGLVALFDTRNAVEVISGQRASVNSSTLMPSSEGVAADFSSTANQQYAHRDAYAIIGSLTILTLLDVDALSSYGAIIAKQATTSTYTPYELRLGTSSIDSNINMVRNDVAALNSRNVSLSNLISAPARGVRLAVTATASLSAFSAYVNGAKFSNSGGTGVTADNGSSSVWIGRRFDGATQLDGRIYYVALFNRILSDAEIAEWDASPWSLFENTSALIPVSWSPDPGVQNASIAHGPYPLVARPSVGNLVGKLAKSQPDINSPINSQFSKDLYCLVDARNPNIDLANNCAVSSLVGGSVRGPIKSSVLGEGRLIYSTTNNEQVTVPAWINVNNEGSFLAVVDRTSYSGSFEPFVVGDTGVIDAFPFSGLSYSNAFWNSRWLSAVSTPSILNLSGPLVFVFSVKNGQQICAVNGVKFHTNTLTSGFTLPATLTLARRGANGTCVGLLWATWKRALTYEECISLSSNPWALFSTKPTVEPPFPGPRRKLI